MEADVFGSKLGHFLVHAYTCALFSILPGLILVLVFDSFKDRLPKQQDRLSEFADSVSLNEELMIFVGVFAVVLLIRTPLMWKEVRASNERMKDREYRELVMSSRRPSRLASLIAELFR